MKSEEREKPQAQEAEQRAAPGADVVYETILKEGEDELKRPSEALAWSGLAAGLSMGFSLVAEGLLRESLPDEPWRPLITKLGYSVGFLIVILGRQQLFTENTLTPMLPLLKRKDLATLLNVLRLWGVVLVANLLGALLFAWVISSTNAFDPGARRAFSEIGREALEKDFWTVLLQGIFAGWLIALVIWLLPFAETARVWVIIIITYLVGLGQFSHIVAGSVETLFLVTSAEISPLAYLGGYMLPTLIGNTLGGVSLVAALNHAQVVAGGGKDV
jgi:formate/nitrite transporter FocA (FNT family)